MANIVEDINEGEEDDNNDVSSAPHVSNEVPKDSTGHPEFNGDVNPTTIIFGGSFHFGGASALQQCSQMRTSPPNSS
jgi:hypothetical protein